MNEYITIKEACHDFRISVRTLYRRLKAKEITPYKFGGKTLIKKTEIEEFIRPK